MTYKVTGLKHLRSNEGFAYNANIRKGRKLVATCSDDGWGGEVQIDFVSKEAENDFRDWIYETPEATESVLDFWRLVIEGTHENDFPFYLELFNERRYNERLEKDGRFVAQIDDPVKTLAAMMCEEKLPAY